MQTVISSKNIAFIGTLYTKHRNYRKSIDKNISRTTNYFQQEVGKCGGFLYLCNENHINKVRTHEIHWQH